MGKISSKPPNQTVEEEKKNDQMSVAKYAFAGAVIAAILGLFGVGIKVYGDWINVNVQVLLPIEYTQTAAAQLTSAGPILAPNITITDAIPPNLPLASKNGYTSTPMPLIQGYCGEIFEKIKIWQGDLTWSCDTGANSESHGSLIIRSDNFSDAEVYSLLIPVKPNKKYQVNYWVKTNLIVDDADVYGKVIVAQYTEKAQEGDEIYENRLDNGFFLGDNLAGLTGWANKSYTFITSSETAFIRLRAAFGLSGKVKGQAWYDHVLFTPVDQSSQLNRNGVYFSNERP